VSVCFLSSSSSLNVINDQLVIRNSEVESEGKSSKHKKKKRRKRRRDSDSDASDAKEGVGARSGGRSPEKRPRLNTDAWPQRRAGPSSQLLNGHAGRPPHSLVSLIHRKVNSSYPVWCRVYDRNVTVVLFPRQRSQRMFSLVVLQQSERLLPPPLTPPPPAAPRSSSSSSSEWTSSLCSRKPAGRHHRRSPCSPCAPLGFRPGSRWESLGGAGRCWEVLGNTVQNLNEQLIPRSPASRTAPDFSHRFSARFLSPRVLLPSRKE